MASLISQKKIKFKEKVELNFFYKNNRFSDVLLLDWLAGFSFRF